MAWTFRDINDADANGETPLMWAASRGHMQVAQSLLKAGASANAAGTAGRVPLHLAAREGRSDLATALLAAGADANIADEAGRTALHLSAQRGHTDIVYTLLHSGADPTLKSLEGRTALDEVAAGSDLEFRRGRIREMLEGALEVATRPFILQLFQAEDELSFRTLAGNVAACLPWSSETPLAELPAAVLAALRSSGFEELRATNLRFVLPDGSLLNLGPEAPSLSEQLAP